MSEAGVGYRGPADPSLGVEALVKRLDDAQGVVAVDTETISIKDRTCIGLSIALGPTESIYFRMLPDTSEFWQHAMRAVARPDLTKVYHNALFDLGVLSTVAPHMYQPDVTNIADTSLIAKVQGQPARLKDLAFDRLGLEIQAIDDILPSRHTMLDLFWGDVASKCMQDSMATYGLYMDQPPEELPPNLLDCYEVDLQLIPILIAMSKRGLALRQGLLQAHDEQLRRDLLYYTDICDKENFNPGSNQQVGMTLAKRGSVLPFTRSRRQLKVSEDILTMLSDPLAALVLKYRAAKKLLSTYVEPWLGQERAYTHFRMDLSTARLASFDRNLQNIPKPMREIFAPDHGIWTSADWSQIELRVWAYVTGDPTMLRAYRESKDIHTITQMALWPNSKPSDPIARRFAKNFNFAMIYLATPETLARSTGLSVRVCQAYREHWLALYPVGYQWMLRQSIEGPEQGYVETLMGRVLVLPLLAESTPAHRSKCAINYPIQGTAAEIVKRGMLIVGGMGIEQAVQVHDELLCDGDYNMPVEKLAHIHGGIYTPVEVTKGPDWAHLITV